MENNTATLENQPPVVAAPIVPPLISVEVPITPVKDLSTKIADFKKTKQVTPALSSDAFFDYKEIEKITDPAARKFAEDAYKSMQSGFTKKTQEIADQKRQFDQKLQDMQNWTPERIQRELSNPQFLQAAQAHVALQNPPNSGLTDEQFSALTPQEKAQIDALKTKITSLEQSNFQATVAQRDMQLQTKYPDYNPSQIDGVIRDLAAMNPLDIREHVYKSMKHDEDVAAAYELGLKESRELNKDKFNAITPNGSLSTTSDAVPVRDPKDTDQSWFQKLANYRLTQFKNRK